MAHHQGMGFSGAWRIVLLGDAFVRRFHTEPMIKATELLLQEKVPWEAPFVRLADDSMTAAASPREGADAGQPQYRFARLGDAENASHFE